MRRLFILVLLFFASGCGGQESASSFLGELNLLSGIRGGRTFLESEAVSKKMVGIYVSNTDGRSSFCSGMILNSRSILTAAHCFDRREIAEQMIFVFYKGTAFATSIGVPADFLKIAIHPKYDNSERHAHVIKSEDIAVISFRVRQGFFPKGFQSVKLLESSESGMGDVMIVGSGNDGGGGVANHLYHAKGKSGILNEVSLRIVAESGKAVCSGDSGGAVFTQDGRSLLAVVKSSVATYAGGCGAITFATRLTPTNIDWIQRQVRLSRNLPSVLEKSVKD